MPQKLPYLEATYSQIICLGLGKVAKIVKFRPIWSPCFILTNLLLNYKHLKDIDLTVCSACVDLTNSVCFHFKTIASPHEKTAGEFLTLFASQRHRSQF